MHKLILFSLCLALLLASCGKEKEKNEFNGGIITTDVAEGTNAGETHIFEDGNRITITSLSEWQAFNYDGNFSDNCRDFIRMFTEGYSAFEEFSTVKVENWEIIRDPHDYGNDLAFNFTVTESGLNTLPKGEYHTVINDAIDCYISFESPNSPIPAEELEVLSDEAKAVKEFILSYYNYYLPDYGTANTILPIANFIIERYGADGKMPIDVFAKKVEELFGISVDETELAYFIAEIDKVKYVNKIPVNGNTEFAVIGETAEGDYTAVTVQFYADCNRFIKSDVIKYYVGKDMTMQKCETITQAEYKPYGLKNRFYNTDL